MMTAIIEFAMVLGLRILKAMNAKDEYIKSYLAFWMKYNLTLFEQSATLKDEWDALDK